MPPVRACLRIVVGRWRWLRAVGAAGVAVFASCAAGPMSMVAPEGPAARRITSLWWLMVVLAVGVYLAVLLFLALALGTKGRAGRIRDRLWIVGGGIVLPVVVLIPLGAVSFVSSVDLLRGDAGEQALRVEVIGHKFWWEIRYPDEDVLTANELHIPVGRPVVVDLRSADVIHSFWVPRLHGKMDLVPGRSNQIRIQADRPGQYRGVCAEYCGIQHARMHILVIASPDGEFEGWLDRHRQTPPAPDTAAALRGREVFFEAGCADCHAVGGTPATERIGPDLTHVAGRRTLAAVQLPNNRGTLGGWIVDPQATKPGNLMPPTRLDGEELDALLAYLETLR